jgi:hypothetical protein
LENLTAWLHGLAAHTLQKLRRKALYRSWARKEKLVMFHALVSESDVLISHAFQLVAPNSPQNGGPFVTNGHRRNKASA